MNRGVFAVQLNEAERLFDRISLLRERVHSPLYARYSAADFRHLSYLAVWKKCYDEQVYDFRLADDSLIQFRGSFDPLELSYSYYECPYIPIVTLERFIEQERFARGEDADEYDLLRDYELLIPSLRDTVTPLRYDYASHMYKEGLHPAAHIHFGHRNEIRVGTKRVLKPLSFVLFLIRQCYPKKWKSFTQLEGTELLCRNVAQNLDLVQEIYLQHLDTWEMYLS